ncbi:phage tail protein [Pseudomonas qingdaonensis]|uniref:phage tail protein n=1 Tax=Pseudomonas qingdaonensis TaxID=2056231 RepID=UPI0036CF220B
MTDQNSQFFAILTAVGEAKQANADALGVPWTFSHMGVGDANQTEPSPSREQTRLINERRRAPLNQLSIDPDNASIIIAEQVIPPDVGGWWIREIGLYDADGDLVAVANCAPSYKPLLSQGTGKTQVVRLNLAVTSTANVVLKIDPSVVLATRQYVDQRIVEVLPATRPAGSYTKVTINNRGVVTGGSNPSTLSGYGITNAYTASEVDKALGFKANLNSPRFSGIPEADTAAVGTNSSQLATCGFVHGSVKALIGAAPGGLDTLVELAAALGNDPNFATTITNALADKAPITSPAFTGIPTASTADLGAANFQIANTLFVANTINALLTDPWALQPIGVPIPILSGAAQPPTNRAYRYVKLSAGDPYNDGVLFEETVSGEAPLLSARARISLTIGSPIGGNSVQLLNTERRYIRPGQSGALQDDAIQNITASITGQISTAIAVTAGGAIRFTPSNWSAGVNVEGRGIENLTFDASRVARTATETRTRNIGSNLYMRVK